MIVRRHAHDNVVLKPKPERRISGLDTSLLLIRVNNLPTRQAGGLQSFLKCLHWRDVQKKRPEIGIGLLLLSGDVGSTILSGIGRLPPQRQDRDKHGWILRIGRNIVNGRNMLCSLFHLPRDAGHQRAKHDSQEGQKDCLPRGAVNDESYKAEEDSNERSIGGPRQDRKAGPKVPESRARPKPGRDRRESAQKSQSEASKI